ncbi:glycine betaine ABC transporter substrate-binding protein [Mariniphaga sediminis]|uniref:glycine betaine ABC transporter substrate-binding protein n=1 Tax=Mariniphaga sediminis TaxID=1628158 RepID=UPI0035638516
MKQKAMYNWIYKLTMILFIVSCVNKPPGEEEMTLKMVYTDWSESVAITYLSAVLLEEEMDYSIILKLTDVESAYREIASGEADIFVDAWLPETHKMYMSDHSGKIEKIGISYPEARTGLLVPAYSSLQTIAGLKNYKNPVIGIDEGAGVMQKARHALEKYRLPQPLLSLSEGEMITQLEDSIERRKDIVITGWEPHWIFARYDVKFLEDPDNVFGEKESIYTVGRIGIEEEQPNAVRFFERMQFTEKQLNGLVYAMKLSEDPRQGVKKWIKENEYTVNQWVKNLKPVRKKIM